MLANLNSKRRSKAYGDACGALPEEDKVIASRLNMQRGPMRSYVDRLFERAGLEGVRVVAPHCEVNSTLAFLTLARIYFERWKKQARAVEKAIWAGELKYEMGDLRQCATGRVLKLDAPMWGMHTLCTRISEHGTGGMGYLRVEAVGRSDQIGKVNEWLAARGDRIIGVDQLYRARDIVGELINLKSAIRAAWRAEEIELRVMPYSLIP